MTYSFTKCRDVTVLAMALAMFGASASAAVAADLTGNDAPYIDVLDMHGAPKTATDRSFNIFFDAGSWHGYSLPPAGDASTGFTGPFLHSLHGGEWVGERFAQLVLKDAGHQQDVTFTPLDSHAGPGYLVRDFTAPGLTLRQTLFFADSWHALVRIELTSTAARDTDVTIEGHVMPASGGQVAKDGGAVVQTFADSKAMLTTTLLANGMPGSQVTQEGAVYRIHLDHPLHLQPGRTTSIFVDQTLIYDRHIDKPSPLDTDAAWATNRAHWAGYLKTLDTDHVAGLADDDAKHVSAKAIMTLLGNWRAARGDLHHDGVIPSYSNPDFNGFWAWDSWKHVAALAHFAPDLARDQMRAMFDYQAADGMVPDCIYLDKAENNWRDTKPPLAVWATLEIYHATGDKAFLAEMYDKLVRYHRWWFKARDHDHNGLAEFGATDGTRIAAAWESGMDNAVRFDSAVMLKNGDGAWSLDQESVDLNAYLYKEKLDLAEMAQVLGKKQDHDVWLKEAAVMKGVIQARMFDSAEGYFFDARLGKPDLVRVYGSEGWTPLWAGVATDEQARSVVRVMLDPEKFNTYMPFPTLAKDDPRFSPIKGYWRGPVWLDQAYFGVEALRRYGYEKQADEMTSRLVLSAQGLTKQAPMYENYDPLTGHGYQSPNFSWSAASYLLLMRGTGETRHMP
ncbi:MGH1-like glycoside hydrolase domain-containing protein [Dyella sp. 20L07]|uniref:MGH1-like glycoside hydrolase domain-containing protein n=1 Tax=Dyella sp. 20L07 TaxID=3384240 RepID=UPI003D2C7E93